MKGTVKDRGAQSAAAAQRAAGLVKANRRRQEERTLKAEVRSGKLHFIQMVNDRRARKVKVLTLLRTIPRCTLHVALEALLVSRINGARCCGELTPQEQSALAEALARVGHAVGGARRPPFGDGAARRDKALDQAVGDSRRDTPRVELAPSEFAAARTGLGPTRCSCAWSTGSSTRCASTRSETMGAYGRA